MADFAIIMGAAVLGGLVAFRLKLPVILGYLVAGIVIGPNSLALVQDSELIETMASIGVVLLLFTLGMEFSLGELRRVGKTGLTGGIIQILATAMVGFLAGVRLFRWSLPDAIFFGFLIALSSTMVVLKILVERGETDAPHGRIMIAILLLQDLAVLPLIIVLPVLRSFTADVAFSLAATLLTVILFLGLMTIVGFWLVPLFLGRAAGTRSRELFLVTILAICLGAAFSTSYVGVSAAFGAFAAGMLVSRSHFAHQALADVSPLRNAFAALFFVSLGMLAAPAFIAANLGLVLAVATVIIVSKFIICALIVRGFGHGIKTILYVGAGLTQVGEFSFVIGKAGQESGVISANLYSVVLSSAILTILFTPLAFKLTDVAYSWLSRSRRMAPFMHLGADERLSNVKSVLSNHVVICGHGRTGSNLSNTLRQYGVPYVVIEMNPKEIDELQEQGVPCIFGDAGNPHILAMAHVKNARLLALTCPDPMAQITASTYAKEVNPGIDIVARLPEPALGAKLRQLGVTKIVDPAFEAGLEFVRHTLQRYNVAATEIEGMVCPALRDIQSNFLSSGQVEESLIQKE